MKRSFRSSSVAATAMQSSARETKLAVWTILRFEAGRTDPPIEVGASCHSAPVPNK